MNVAFHSNQLGMRGTEVALYDYALYNEIILGNKSVIISDKNKELSTLDKFKSKFEVFLYNNFKEAQSFVDKSKIDFTYFIKSGNNDGKLLSNTRNSIHAVFQERQIHGDNYAYVSEWLANKMGIPDQYVPHIVTLPKPTKTYRDKLGIPTDAIVVGRYGGYNEFDLPAAQRAIINTVSKRDNIYFLMMNTSPFFKHKQIIYVDGTYDLQNKSNFIETCNYMIHARGHGESFGLSICEFLYHNKPVITFRGGYDLNHLTILGDKGIYYTDEKTLIEILLNIDIPKFNVNHLVTQFAPEVVMEKFKNILLK